MRIVVKLGTALITGGNERVDVDFLREFVRQVSTLHKEGHEILVVTSGAVAAGREKLGIDRKDVPSRQVLAAIGQGRLIHIYEELFSEYDITIAQTLLTRADISERLGYLNARNTLLSLLRYRIIPIINENDVVAVEELEGRVFGDNDTLSALVANLVDADLLIILSEVDGLFSKDPRRGKGELLRDVFRIDEEIEKMAGGAGRMGRGGMITKVRAAKLATSSGTKVIIANGKIEDVLIRLVRGEKIGTLFHPSGTKLESRKRFLLSQIRKGWVLIDKGAEVSIRERNSSLLPIGVVDVGGYFERGDVIDVRGEDGVIGCGIANYSSEDVRRIKGHHSKEIANILGYEYGEEIIHRDNLVIL